MEYFKAELMEMCHRENLYQIDLLHGSANRITEREYWAQKKGQIALDEFSHILLRQGISVKESRRRLSYLTPDRAKPITARRLGDDFDRAAVFARLEQNTLANIERRRIFASEQAAQPAPPRSIHQRLQEAGKVAKAQNEQRVQRMVDVEAKAAKGRGMEQWAKVFNLKQMAAAQFLYEASGYQSRDELDAAISTAQAELQESRAAIKAIEAKIGEKKELQKWVIFYAKTRDVRDDLKKIKSDKKRAAYRVEHESDFVISDAAIRYFKSRGIQKIPGYKALQAEIETLIAEKNAAYSPYLEQKNRLKELQTIQQNLAALHNEPPRANTKKHEQEK